MKALILSVATVLFSFSAHASSKTWGAQGAALTLNFDTVHPPAKIQPGSTVEFDCAHGTLDNVVSDKHGGFAAFGTLESEQGGQVSPGQVSKVKRALYVAQLDAQQNLKLSTYVLSAGSPELVREDSVSASVEPRLMKCLGSASANN